MSGTPVTEEDREALAALVAQWHPGAQQDLYTEGYDHTLIVAEGRAYRFPRNDHYRARVKIESDFLRAFGPRCPLAIPQPEYRGHPTPHSVYDFIPGAQFQRGAFGSYDLAQRAAAAAAIGEFLTALHAFPAADAQRLGVEEQTWFSLANDPVGGARAALPLLEASLRIQAERMLDHHAHLLFEPHEEVVLHYDLAGEHILHDGKKITAVIDFGDLALGDAVFDFRFAWEFGEDFMAEVFANYGGTRDAGFDARRHLCNAIGLLRFIPSRVARADPDVPRFMRDLAASLILLEKSLS